MSKGGWREFDNASATFTRDSLSDEPPRSLWNVRVQKTRVGKAGKTVTVISGLRLDQSDLKKLLKKIKGACGTGGTLKETCLELQGDQVHVLIDLLKKEGFSPKISGG